MSKPIDHRLERLVFFSDAVFAIAITLLIIEVKVPHVEHGLGEAAAWQALGAQWQSLASFVLSFLVIGRFWIGHHAALGTMVRYDPRLLWPNLLLLMSVAFMPFATAFMAANFTYGAAFTLYSGAMVVTALLSHWVTDIAIAPENTGPSFSAADRKVTRRNGYALIMAMTLALILTFIVPGISQLAMATVPLFNHLLLRQDRTA